MNWYPLRLSSPIRDYVFGGRAIAERLGRTGLPHGPVAETWEVSDLEGESAVVSNGPLAGCTLRELVEDRPGELVCHGWSGPHFPVLTKFVDATGMLPVHLHADDATARRLQAQPNGKTEAWHVLDAVPGATALVGVKEGVGHDELRAALLEQDFDAVMRRLPVRPGETVYVPGGTLHSFGPRTLVYEIEQTSDIQQHAMPWRVEDGSPLGRGEWHAGVERLLEEWRPEPRPDFQPGLRIPAGEDVERVICCAGPYFALERWRVAAGVSPACRFDTALVVSNVGAPVAVEAGGWCETLGPARTLLLPAALGLVRVSGPADLLVGYLPNLERDIRAPLAASGYGPQVIASLGEGLAA
ncbi:type I phosphomannose isomerase catalytic subunit [Streptosporangium sandarakinum]|uniref:type I phosphomannose isomerase catalytic subunit n=1 Tax=Streptosporangium sandarakinum TaxID=1260955 RepID=UPI0033A99870